MTRSDLLATVYQFYPRGLFIGTDEYNRSEERRRQWQAARRSVAEYPTWKAMLRRLGARYSVVDHSVRVLGAGYLEGGYDQAYSGEIDLPGHSLGFYVSLLGPYYGIRRLGLPGEEPAALDVAREIEATYPGYEEIPPELGNEVVPDVAVLGETTIYICLLSDVWPWSSGPLDVPPPPGPVLPPLPEGWVQELESVRSYVPKAPDPEDVASDPPAIEGAPGDSGDPKKSSDG